jgi:hypothetical protein
VSLCVAPTGGIEATFHVCRASGGARKLEL